MNTLLTSQVQERARAVDRSNSIQGYIAPDRAYSIGFSNPHGSEATVVTQERIVRRVLVVDDEAKNLEAARSWMPDREVLVEDDPTRVIERVRSEKPCLVIVDLWLGPEASGDQVATAIKAENPKLPVAVISAGLDVRAALLLARNCTADLILPKQGRRTFDEILAFVEDGIEPCRWGERDLTMSDVKREYAQRVVAQSGGNKSEAARRVGVSRMTMNRWLGDPDEDG